MWGVWVKYLPVTFDSGDWGTINSGRTQATYQAPVGSSLGALNISVPEVQLRDETYEFRGWTIDGDETNTIYQPDDISAAPVTEPVTYLAAYAEVPEPLSDHYYGVTFDAGGVYGNITGSGESKVVYSVITDSALNENDVNSVPWVMTTSGDYTFTGWGLPGDGGPMSNDAILNAKVDEPVTYVAFYGMTPEANVYYSCAVIFDSGGVYGSLSDGTTSTAISVEKGTPLGDVPSFVVPTVVTKKDFSFVGWSPVVDMASPVKDVVRYLAQYAYTPDGSSSAQVYHTVSFDLGPEGAYKSVPPLTSYLVEDGASLGGIMTTDDTPLFDKSYFVPDNIAKASDYPDFEFVGWSPTLDAAAPVYADRVYRAQYSYEPEGLSNVDFTHLNIDDDTPDEHMIHALGYNEYYDGNPHYITYSAIGLDGVLSFWLDPSEKGLPLSESLAVSSGGIWEEGIPPGEVNVTDEVVDLIFTADGKIPQEITRSAIIKPRPLVPEATHVEMTVGDDIPLRASYGLTMDYDGKAKDGTLIGDGFSFAGHEKDFDTNTPQITTTYLQGDPAGDYPIYVKAGVYGNYEIYEGTSDGWPAFAGWRLAGTMHVNAADDEGGDPPTPSGGGITPPPSAGGGSTPPPAAGVNTPIQSNVVNPPATPATGSSNVDSYDDSVVSDDDSYDDSDDSDSDSDDSDDEDYSAPGSESGVAKTGDDAHPALWMTLLIVSFMALATLISYARRRRLQ
jgi:hypothetical protein